MQTIRVNLGTRSYDIAVVTDRAGDFAEFFRQRFPKARRAMVVADPNTRQHADPIRTAVNGSCIDVPSGESTKCLAELERLWHALAAMPADRGTPVVAVGGGVIGDLAGFAAASYNRGIPLVMVPTTLLAMVDSSVGGKTGINLPHGKNLVGAFHQPAAVWIDTAVLETLPDREYRSGLAEVVKYGVILDPELFDTMEANVPAILNRTPEIVRRLVARSCQLKADVVEKDEREETGLRAILNYGHTFAHAFETVGGYGAWLHGEAVAAGMVAAARTAVRHGLIDDSLNRRQVALLTALGLPVRRRAEWSIDAMVDVMRRDKKNVGGAMRFVLPVRMGEVRLFDDVPESVIRDVLSDGD